MKNKENEIDQDR